MPNDEQIIEIEEQIEFTKNLLEDPTLPQEKKQMLSIKLQELQAQREAFEKTQYRERGLELLVPALAFGGGAYYSLKSKQSILVPILSGLGAMYIFQHLQGRK